MKPKNIPNKLKNKKIINKIVEIRNKYGKTKIKKIIKKHKGKHAFYIKEAVHCMLS